MVILAGLFVATSVALLGPFVSDLVSLARLRSRPARAPERPGGLPRFVFLVPAYNEELLIEECVASLRAQRYPRDRFEIVVIADNCTDRTAPLARGAGATCLERNDPAHPGKPQAVSWALKQLPANADAVVIIDADTVVDTDFASVLARLAPLREKAIQVRNGVSNPNENAITRMAAVLASAKFEYALPLRRMAGLNVPLGAGSCIGTGVLERHGWQALSIGEDLEMYAMLTVLGVEIDLAREARLFAQEARSLKQVSSQRRRWTAGRLMVLRQYFTRILRSRAIGPHQKLDIITELSTPGPVVHLGIVLVMTIAGLAVHLPWWILGLAWVSLIRPVGYALIALWRMPGRWRTLAAFLYLPIYGAWRLAVEATALLRIGEKSWIRTARHLPGRTVQ